MGPTHRKQLQSLVKIQRTLRTLLCRCLNRCLTSGREHVSSSLGFLLGQAGNQREGEPGEKGSLSGLSVNKVEYRASKVLALLLPGKTEVR